MSHRPKGPHLGTTFTPFRFYTFMLGTLRLGRECLCGLSDDITVEHQSSAEGRATEWSSQEHQSAESRRQSRSPVLSAEWSS